MKLRVIGLMALLFAGNAIAEGEVPQGEYQTIDGKLEMTITADGSYDMRFEERERTYIRLGMAFVGSGCTHGDKEGNLWTVDSKGEGWCYRTTVNNGKLVIQEFDSAAPLGGIWVSR